MTLTLDTLHAAVSGTAAAFRCRTRLQPAGGQGDKVFPPTYAGAVYATEKRCVPAPTDENPDLTAEVDCVLLDSVQSQANRMEEALQRAFDEGRLRLPLIEVNFDPFYPGDEALEDKGMRLLDPVGKVTSLEAPHRIADAILRDSLLDGVPFRQSERGRAVDRVSLKNATPLFELCPTALLFGMWDSTGPKGGLGAKFERAIVSEIVGIDATHGVRTASRVDPIVRKNPELYQAEDGGWTVLEPEAAKDSKKNPKPFGKKVSEINLGNVTPDVTSSGGVTIAYAEQTIVLSLPALRRLRFPVDGVFSVERDRAGRTVLAALGLAAAALADESGLDLRSRCLLYPTKGDLQWERLDRSGVEAFHLPAEDAIKVFHDAVDAARNVGLPWMEQPLVLTPSDALVKLVAKSQQLAAQQGGED
ncbi:type I-G CRISPR-associated RAMP protein Csb1/Cas7g [Stratiformator vulcanicus]|uniref:CRISPR-associated protein (Cas_GSU0053) n=1 Tax=Stratiformator vulcanicus TaxID=2527980 RepID=A0A517QWJ8_9PLAN|nr:type I-U CRISPR-associated RAMP protein Csb1/Cas7u [Stratiformator vulcanicus]QDT36039.1 CRISPR-associated protein (Cas_GSU0053) [Stratiformator vulcanicus]